MPNELQTAFESCIARGRRARAGWVMTPLLALAVTGPLASPAVAATEVQFWHAMQGALNEQVSDLVRRFNESQADYRVVPVYKGSYPETMTAAVAAARAKAPPHIVQIFEVGTATMAAARGAIVSVEDVMRTAGEPFDRNAFIPAVAGYYAMSNGQMLSFPFNSSTAVMYYNRDALGKVGVDKPPRTWEDLFSLSARLVAARATPCGFTTAWPAWTQLENFSAWHDVAYASRGNGFDGSDARLLIDTPLHARHLENLAKLSRDGVMTYAGRRNEAEAKFFSGDCAMLTSSSAAMANIRRNARFSFGVAPLPHYADVKGAPQNSIIGGASLWVMNGHTTDAYKGVARFFSFLSRPEIQAQWHQQTGYLPVTKAAYELTKASGYYGREPGAAVSVEQMVNRTTDRSRGVRLGFLAQIRDVEEEEFEKLLNGQQDARQALRQSVARGNELLERFARSSER